MTQEQQQTASDGTPPVPTFDFGVKKKRNEGEGDPVSEGVPEQLESSSNSEEPETPKSRKTGNKGRQSRSQKDIGESVTPFEVKRYVNLSTKTRRTIQLALAELSYKRKTAKKPHSIKHFIEEALSEWNESKRSKLNFVTQPP